MLANVLQKADSHISALERRLVEKREQGKGMPFIQCTYHAFGHQFASIPWGEVIVRLRTGHCGIVKCVGELHNRKAL